MTKPEWVVGYTTRNHLLLDLDDTSYFKVERLVDMLMRSYPAIGNALILRSSSPREKVEERVHPLLGYSVKHKRHNYHVVFNNFVDYEYSCGIIETLAELDVINKDYVKIRFMRQDMTLRTSHTVKVEETTPAPHMMKFVINPYSIKQDNGIYLYMQLYKCFRQQDECQPERRLPLSEELQHI